MTDGTVYAFSAPQSVNDAKRCALNLKPGFRLDTRAWTTERIPELPSLC